MSGQVALPQSADVVLHAVALLQPRLLDPLTGYWEAVTKMHVTCLLYTSDAADE